MREVGVDNTNRRKWDRLEYLERAEERERNERQKNENPMDAKRHRRWERDPLHQGLIVQRTTLKPRDYQLDLTSRLGKTQVITLNTPLNQQAGFYCSVCDCILRDSQSYLDHINGKWHNRALGMSMRVERSTIEQVKRRFEKNKKLKRKGGLVKQEPDEKTIERLEYNEKDLNLSDEDIKKDGDNDEGDENGKKLKIEEENSKKIEETGGLDPVAAALMGFSGFGSTKQ